MTFPNTRRGRRALLAPACVAVLTAGTAVVAAPAAAAPVPGQQEGVLPAPGS